MKVIWRYFASVFVFLLFVGSFGLVELEDCDETLSDAAKIECYHLAALSLAYRGPGYYTQSESACWAIVYDVGARHMVDGKPDDLGKRAEIEKNNCLYDIAKVTRDPSYCNGIEESELGWAIFGATTTKDICLDQVGRLQNLDPDVYYEDENSLCKVIFILPILLIAAFLKR